jgi:DNA-binding transcriptional ArsR family regulator
LKQTQTHTIDPRLVRAVAHPLRIQILEILSERVASPNDVSEQLEVDLTHVAYHTRALQKCGCLELVDTARRRGATEHFYKASPESFIGDRRWRRVPRSIRGGVSAAALQTYIDKAVAALEAGTIDARDDTTLSWMPLLLDLVGWNEVTAILEETIERVLEAEARSRERLGRRGARAAISAVASLANFETAGSRGA